MRTVKIDISQISQVDKRILATRFSEAVKRFYEKPANLQRFEEQQKKRGK